MRSLMLHKIIGVLVLLAAIVVPALGQTSNEQKMEARIATRERLRTLLENSGPKKGINITFHQSEKQPFNFVGVARDGLINADSMEVVIGVSQDDTIGFRIFPHYKDAYINVNRVKNSAGLMRQLLLLNDKNFLFWGADDSGDVFAGYTFTLESGFPDRAIEIVLYSIAPLDKYVGEMRANVEGVVVGH